MRRGYVYGISPYLPDAPFFDADELNQACGGNTGNLLFCHAVSRMIGAGPVSISWGSDVSHLSPETDCLVLPLANQLGPHVDLSKLAEIFEKVAIPMVAIGLGTQGPITGVDPESIPEGSWNWLRSIIRHAPTARPNIALRGETTMQAVSAKGFADHCIVTGCPSNFINPSASLGREIYRRRANGLARIVVAAGNPFLPQFRRLEQSLASMVEDTDGLYVCQHPIDLLRLYKQEYNKIDPVVFKKYLNYIRPGMSGDDFLEWFRRYAYSYTSVPDWLSSISRFDVVVGTRIHGVMAGIQAGIPGLCLCIDSRTLELCRTMAVPHVDANEYRDGITREQIAELLRKWDSRQFDETRRMLADRLAKFLRWNDIEPHGSLKEIITKRNSLAFSYQNKAGISEVHQVSTASFDGRYTSIYTALENALSMATPRLLSFGCSDGFELHDLASNHFHHGYIIGCDVDLEALRIARKHNRYPSRVSVIKSEPETVRAYAPFDAVVAMSVLCRWPDTRDKDDINHLYSFEKFSGTVEYLVSLLRPGGILCIYNANYSIIDTPSADILEVIQMPSQLPRTQPVRLFGKDGRPLKVQDVPGILFRKRL